MRRSRVLIAAVVALVGIFWIGQGLDVIKGSAMTGNSFWAAVGVILLIVAAAILLRERRPATPR
jgi:lipopolysaccharide export LptBFGC system permease protein LptF